MNLAIFVHDLHNHIGHSNALIEKINHLDSSKIKHIYCLCYTFSPAEELFPKLSDRITYIKIPFPNLKPFLIKEVFYHLVSALYYLLFVPVKCKRISIGIASLFADIVDLQFVHQHFQEYFFSYKKLSGISLLYKKMLFKYYVLCEKFMFSNNKKYLALSSFVEDYMISEYQIQNENIQLAYSSVNRERFHFIGKSRKDILNELIKEYPDLSILNLEKTIHLFVGAFDRKGLFYVLNQLAPNQENQIIIIGQPEAESDIFFPNIQIVHIPFTKRLNEFYNLSDHFVFPTVYEPYGLVILEAFAAGLHISVTKKNVGASEILIDQPNVYIYDNQENFKIKDISPISVKEREEICKKRIDFIEKISWKKAAEKLQSFLA